MKQDYIVRARVTEGLGLVFDARVRVATSTSTALELRAAADDWNLRAGNTGESSKYMTSVLADRATGEITVTYSALLNAAVTGTTMVLTPCIGSGGAPVQVATSIATAAGGPMDWGCSSLTHVTASARSLPPLVPEPCRPGSPRANADNVTTLTGSNVPMSLSIERFDLRSRCKAAAIHLLISLAVASIAALLVFVLWYPGAFRYLAGGRNLFLLVMSVDVVMGPVLSFTVFNAGTKGWSPSPSGT